MSEHVLQIEGLSKKYQLDQVEPGRGLRHVLDDAWRAPARWWRRRSSSTASKRHEEFWALRDVSFTARRGEVVGIIGRNGAGKSTLLKLVSRITEPTRGSITLRGRVASLLEVGTGFHPELTGRENIFLNGAILGMQRAEIARKFDAIVAFAEVERFLETPVKRYSSGMYMRLAFAVAAHLEPEILIVDEVLAVGDAAFQQRCLGKMNEVATQHGRTVLFVSHNLNAVQKLCGTCHLLDGGTLVASGRPAEIVRKYMDLGTSAAPAPHPSSPCTVDITTRDESGAPARIWMFGQKLHLEVNIRTRRTLSRPAVDIAFYDERRIRLFVLQSDSVAPGPSNIDGSWTARFTVANPGLTVSELTFDVGIREGAGSYVLLLTDAGRLTPDYASLTDTVAADCLLHPSAVLKWESTSSPVTPHLTISARLSAASRLDDHSANAA